MRIEFDEISLTTNGIEVAPIAGWFEVNSNGEIETIAVEQFYSVINKARPHVVIGPTGPDGMAIFLWHVLKPTLRKQFADRIADHCRECSRRPSHTEREMHRRFERMGA